MLFDARSPRCLPRCPMPTNDLIAEARAALAASGLPPERLAGMAGLVRRLADALETSDTRATGGDDSPLQRPELKEGV